MNMAKKKARAAARAAQLGVSEEELAAADTSGAGGGTGRPGGLARLGFVLKKGGKGKVTCPVHYGVAMMQECGPCLHVGSFCISVFHTG